MDYYAILEIPKGCLEADIKKAYRKLAMKWHPDKNPDKLEEASKKFQEIGEAFDVLSDAQRRAIYDQYGYDGLINGVPEPTGGSTSAAYSYQNNAQEMFESFFGTANPFASFGFGDSAPFASKLNKPPPQKPDPIKYNLDCTLTELYNGCVKRFNITRKKASGMLNDDGSPDMFNETKTLTINVRPGWKEDTKVTFPNEGDECPGKLTPDVQFVIKTKEDPELPGYSRSGNDLIYTCKLSLSDALTDCSLRIPTMDKRVISIACPEVVSPYYEKLIPGEGMPNSKTGKKGDLIVRFHILFPKYLNLAKKEKIREILAGEELQT